METDGERQNDFSNLEITSPTLSDTREIYALQKKFLRTGQLFWNTKPDDLKKYLDFEKSVIAKENGETVAFLLTFGVQSDTEDKRSFLKLSDFFTSEAMQSAEFCIGQICIDHHWQGKGLFSKMYAIFKNLAQDKYAFRFLTTKNNEKSFEVHKARIDTSFLGKIEENGEDYLILAMNIQNELSNAVKKTLSRISTSLSPTVANNSQKVR